ncbi:unnamed protein product [Spodoptera exigua]|nr:unnamed protein product [Spodoptera exigua]
MFRLIILTTVLGTIQGVKDYGNYTAVMMYAGLVIDPVCVTVAFNEYENQPKCVCSDGNESILMEIKFIERLDPHKQIGDSKAEFEPMVVVENTDNVVNLMNVTCGCAGRVFNGRSVVRNVNDNYMIAYVRKNSGRFDVTFVVARVLLAKNLPSASKLQQDISRIAELRDQVGARLCTKEIRDDLMKNN